MKQRQGLVKTEKVLREKFVLLRFLYANTAKPSVFPPAILEFPFCSRIRILDILELYVHVLLACICAREPVMSGFINDPQVSAETLSRE